MNAVLRWADGIVGASRWAAFPSPSPLADANASDSFTARLVTPRVATSPSSAHTVAHRGLGTERIFVSTTPRLGKSDPDIAATANHDLLLAFAIATVEFEGRCDGRESLCIPSGYRPQ